MVLSILSQLPALLLDSRARVALGLIVALALVKLLRRKRAAQEEKRALEIAQQEESAMWYNEDMHKRDPVLLQRLEDAKEFFHRKGDFGTFVRPATDDVPIAFGAFEHENEVPTGPIFIICTGWSESFIKYAEVIEDVYNRMGACVYALDHRGQGLSGRHCPNSQMTYVKDFEDHVFDLDHFVENTVIPRARKHESQSDRRVVLLGFSMGGLVATRYVVKFPQGPVNKLVLVSPCLAPLVEGLPQWLVLGLCKFMCFLGYEQEYVFGHSDADHRLLMPPSNKTSRSIERIKNWEDLRGNVPEANVNGMSFKHLEQLLLARITALEASSIKLPVLLLSSSHDLYVDNTACVMFEENCKPCTHHVMPDTLHELLQEECHHRNQVLDRICSFAGEC